MKSTLREFEIDRLRELYEYLCLNFCPVVFYADIRCGYLVRSLGRDGGEYYWYSSELDEAAISVRTGQIVTGDRLIDLFC